MSEIPKNKTRSSARKTNGMSRQGVVCWFPGKVSHQPEGVTLKRLKQPHQRRKRKERPLDWSVLGTARGLVSLE